MMPLIQRPRRGVACRLLFLALSAVALLAAPQRLSAQQLRVDDRNFGERLVVIVPIVGDGSALNPRRPLYTPEQPGTGGILSYSVVLSDDRRFALVELVARDRKAFDEILKDARTDVKKFDYAKGSKNSDIELEFRKLKKDFDFAKFKEGK